MGAGAGVVTGGCEISPELSDELRKGTIYE